VKKPVPTSVQKRIQRARMVVFALVGVIVAIIAGFAIYALYGGAPDELAEGKQYRTLDNPKPVGTGLITVTEFFSYACPHCMTFEPSLAEWVEDLPDDVRFERVPVSYSAEWTLLAQTYYVLLRLRALDANHERIFSAIHDKGRVFRSKEELAELVDGHDITRAEFLAAFDSNETRRAMNEAARLTQAYSITSVPTIVVGDRWVILPDVPRRDTLPVATQLIEKLRAERAGSAAPN
jgi:thiol:disulfide interchange protein DsbA